MASAEFAPLADALASDHTVVTYDPRGIAAARSTTPGRTPPRAARRRRPPSSTTGAESADVFGSSGGAVTGGAGRPAPPGCDARRPRAAAAGAAARAAERSGRPRHIATFHLEGMRAAWFKFMARRVRHVGPTAPAADPGRPRGGPRGRPVLRHDLQATTRYLPDIEALRAARCRRHRRGLGPPAHLPDLDGAGGATARRSRSSFPAITPDSWMRQRNSLSCVRCHCPAETPRAQEGQPMRTA